MARFPSLPGPKTLLAGLDALGGGIAVGERFSKGDRWQAAGVALTLAIPLLWKKRLASLALAGLAGLISYYFFEELHEPEIVTEPVALPSRASLN